VSGSGTRTGPIGPLWLEYAAYAGRLLLGSAPPYLDAPSYIAWERKAQSLLNSDVVPMPVGHICSQWLQQQTEVRRAMENGKRRISALRLLLQQEGLRAHLVQLSTALRSSFPRKQLAIVCPTPAHWINAARGHDADSGSVPDGPDIQEVESASLYMADFLREFRSVDLDMLLLEESGRLQSDPVDVSGYQSVFNVGASYNWRIGLHIGENRVHARPSELTFVVSTEPQSDLVFGQEMPETFWETGRAPERPAGGFRYARIPVHAQPERVLDRVASLR
jgi:hypothetical protein